MVNSPGAVRPGSRLSGSEPVMDSFTYEGAATLAARIAAYWWRQRREVRVWVEKVAVAGLPSVWVVRSDLLNGFPRS
jgi:hypothetical protein